MQEYQKAFIEFSIACDVLRFGQFTLKSGRTSPYFFNAGLYDTGGRMAKLGEFYAQAIVESGIEFDMLFGPAYKGIPLVTAIGIALNNLHGIDVPIAFNRKEKKTHGEGGTIVGRGLYGKVLIVDDVITAGTAIREAIDMITSEGAELAGVMVSLDRQEKGQGELSAIQEVQQQYGFAVGSIVGLSDLVSYLEASAPSKDVLENVKIYRAQYGV